MTEEEAKTKRCPMTRFHVTASDDVYSNRDDGEPAAYCLGSACMMWRWEDHLTKNGYCGLGGKP